MIPRNLERNTFTPERSPIYAAYFMQPLQENVAVIFITKLEGGQTKNEGLCLKCARELGIKPIDDMMKKMGISDEELDNLTNEMMSAFGGAEGMEGLMPQPDGDSDGEDDGRTATFPFLNQLFSGGAAPQQPAGESGPKKEGEEAKRPAPSTPSGSFWTATASPCPARRRRASWTGSSAVTGSWTGSSRS